VTPARERSWHPLLDGQAARRAWSAVNDIAEALRRAPPSGPGLDEGAAGTALFFQALDAARPDRGYDEDVLRCLERSSDNTEVARLGLDFYRGLPGIAWVTERMSGPWTGEPDPHDAIDECLVDAIQDCSAEQVDLISGLAGLGVYTLARLPRPGAIENLERIVRRLRETATESPDGVAWLTSVEEARKLAELGSRSYEESVGYYKLGMAHGAAGIVAFLGMACASGHAGETASTLLADSTRWLLKQADPSFGYGTWILQDGRHTATRSAWCYGNPGVAMSLILAGRGGRRPEWERAGVDLLARDAALPADRCGVIDAGLCHGAFGLAHMYNRAFQATGISAFAEAARRWVDEGLTTYRDPGSGIAGFRVPSHSGRESEWIDDPGLLTGVSGIGLALLGMVAPAEPRWDAILLTEIPA
jgi:class I lanthipeptide synthase